MVERQEVEALLLDIEEVEALLLDIGLTADEHRCRPADVAFEVEGDTLAALCRAWLAVEDAPTADVQWDGGAEAYLVFDGGPEEMRGCRWNAHMAEQLHGQRVRIVKEVG